MTRVVRYAISGLGHRAQSTYLPAFGAANGRRHRLVAAIDTDQQLLSELRAKWPHPVATYHAEDLGDLLSAGECDWLIVTAPDHCHHPQILAALHAGVSVITEKPMGLDAAQARQILTAASVSRAQVKVAHNFRFLNLHAEIRRLLARGIIGRVLQLRFDYHLTPGHGGSYFRRWHRQRAASGGLPITKSCHHFDLINWWLDDLPVDVSGTTERRFFHPGSPFPDGLGGIVPLDADIEDWVRAKICYRRNSLVSYSLNACSSWEGYHLEIRGATGTLTVDYDRYVEDDYRIVLSFCSGQVRSLVIPREGGRHSGADQRMTSALFGVDGKGTGPSCLPGGHSGALAVAFGDAVIRSSQSGSPVRLSDILPEICAPPLVAPATGCLA